MMAIVKVASILAIVAAGVCNNGDCTIDDATNLMEVERIVKPGGERQEKGKPEDLSSVVTETFTLADSAAPTLAPGCEDKGCQGTGPNCGGNDYSCTAYNWVATGYYKSCSMADTCETGWKVRCAACPDGVASVAMPVPSPPPPAFVAPVSTPAAATPGAPAGPIVMPSGNASLAAAPFDPQAVNKSTVNLAVTQANLTLSKKALANASAQESLVADNVTLYKSMEDKAHNSFLKNRKAAVHYAKKRQLANITMMKARMAMADAFYAQQGAAQGAQDALAQEANANAMSLYYQKDYINRDQDTKEAQAKVQVAKMAVQKAMSDLSIAQKAVDRFNSLDKSNQQTQQALAAAGSIKAQQLAVQQAQEDAYNSAQPSA